MNPDIEKIAAEAAEKIGKATGCSSVEWEESLIPIIKTAIEKAKDEWNEADYLAREQIASSHRAFPTETPIEENKRTDYGAAHASEQWTNVYVEDLWEKGGSIAVKDAHNNATLPHCTAAHASELWN